MYAKLYETIIGQLLVKLDQGDELEPEVRLYFEPKNLGVCSVAYKYEDSEDGWNKAEEYFESMTEELAIKNASELINGIPVPVS